MPQLSLQAAPQLEPLWKMGEQKGVLATDASLVVPSVVVSWFSGENFSLDSFLGL